jgi:threonine/homoserine/homoserine lactone efflux protein
MEGGLFVRGVLIGFSIAAPVGPIGVLCIRRTLAAGRAVGFVSGLGAATADAFYGSLAAFGLTLVTSFLVGQQTALRVVGGLFLLYLGLRTLLARPAPEAHAVGPRSGAGLAAAYLSTLALTLTNPTTILSFVAIFAGLGVGQQCPGPEPCPTDWGGATLLVVGVFVGSAAWWLLLSGGVGLARGLFSPARLRWVNWLSGAIILAFGLFTLGSLLLAS